MDRNLRSFPATGQQQQKKDEKKDPLFSFTILHVNASVSNENQRNYTIFRLEPQ